MVTNCAPVIADLLVFCLFVFLILLLLLLLFFFFCYERDFMMSFSDDSQLILLKILPRVSGYLDNLLNIDNTFVEGMVTQVYHNELQLNT